MTAAARARADTAEVLLDLAYSARHRDPKSSLAYSSRALALAAVSGNPELRSRALAHMANAYRINGDLRLAQVKLAAARRWAERAKTLAEDALSLCDQFEVWILEEREDWRGAIACARNLFVRRRRLSDLQGQAHAMLASGLVMTWAGEPAAAVGPLRWAVERADIPSLVVSSVSALASALAYSGQPAAAADVLSHIVGCDDLIDEVGPKGHSHLTWIEGHIAAGLGAYGAGRNALLRAREEMAEAGDFLCVGLISIDLATTETLAGRPLAAYRAADDADQAIRAAGGRPQQGMAATILRAARSRVVGQLLLGSVAIEARRAVRRAGAR